MPSTRTKRSRNPGTANSSQSLTSNSDKASNKISRFFTKLPREEMSGNSTSDSPYQNCLKQVKRVNLSDSAGDLDDFRTPNAVKKVSKITKLPKKVKTKKKSSTKVPIRKFLEDNFKNSDVNADHLQMALALSESSYEAENSVKKPSSQEKMENFKKTLEKYGFGYGKNKGETANKKDFYSIVTSSSNKSQKTRSRYRFVTPILKIRTPEEREALISSKVSLILAQNNRVQDYNIQSDPIKLYSEALRQYHASNIFKLNNLSLEELNQEGRFYTKGLPVEACAAPCGYLLKDWGRIPGRDVSPVKENLGVFSEEKSSCEPSSPVLLKNATPGKESPEYIYDGSLSPDLFGSDDEVDRRQLGGACANFSSKSSPPKANGDILNQLNEPNQIKNNQNSSMGSLQSDRSNTEEMLVVECYDLTQSDEDEDLKILEKKNGSFLLSASNSKDSAIGGNCKQSKNQNEDEIDAKEYCLTPEPDLKRGQIEEKGREPPETEFLSKGKSSEPSLKNDNIEKAPAKTECSHLSISSTEEFTEERLTKPEFQSKSDHQDEEENCQDLTHSSEDDWQSDTLEYQFSESLLNNRKKSEPPDDSKLTKTVDSIRKSISCAKSEGFTDIESVKESSRMTPEWEYHSGEYDWQSDAVFQFPEDECQLTEDKHSSPEAIKHNCQTSEAHENRNRSLEPSDHKCQTSEAPENRNWSFENRHWSPEPSDSNCQSSKPPENRNWFSESSGQNHQTTELFENSNWSLEASGHKCQTSEPLENRNWPFENRNWSPEPSDRSCQSSEPLDDRNFSPEPSGQNCQTSEPPKKRRWSSKLSGQKCQTSEPPENNNWSSELSDQNCQTSETPENSNCSAEPSGHKCQSSEPPENRNWSPEPFLDDWVPSPPFGANEEMECYDLSESDDQEDFKKMEKISTSESSKLSQESISISDEELNYSSVHATPHREKKPEHDLEDEEKNLTFLEDSFNDVLGQSVILNQLEPQTSSSMKTPNIKRILQNDNFVIKTKNVTPMVNYDEMDTPKIVKELDKFGLKPLKRQRGAKLLKYIYDSTHPVVDEGSDDDGRIVKKRRKGSLHFDGIVGDIDEDEWVFEKTQSKKVQSCRIPLHIVWHNFVMSNSKIRENILLYEPLQLEVLHSMIKEQGFKFNIQDLLAFLDKKCVTIRTAQGQRYGKKRP